jgi:hypothetical protein
MNIPISSHVLILFILKIGSVQFAMSSNVISNSYFLFADCFGLAFIFDYNFLNTPGTGT